MRPKSFIGGDDMPVALRDRNNEHRNVSQVYKYESAILEKLYVNIEESVQYNIYSHFIKNKKVYYFL